MKKIYEQPEIEVYKVNLNSICVLPQSLEDFLNPEDDVADPEGETLTKRRTFLTDDDADWDLGF